VWWALPELDKNRQLSNAAAIPRLLLGDINTRVGRRFGGLSSRRSRLQTNLELGQGEGYDVVKQLLELASPSAVDFEMLSSSNGPDDEDGARVLAAWLDWVSFMLEKGESFELVQAILSRLLR